MWSEGIPSRHMLLRGFKIVLFPPASWHKVPNSDGTYTYYENCQFHDRLPKGCLENDQLTNPAALPQCDLQPAQK